MTKMTKYQIHYEKRSGGRGKRTITAQTKDIAIAKAKRAVGKDWKQYLYAYWS